MNDLITRITDVLAEALAWHTDTTRPDAEVSRDLHDAIERLFAAPEPVAAADRRCGAACHEPVEAWVPLRRDGYQEVLLVGLCERHLARSRMGPEQDKGLPTIEEMSGSDPDFTGDLSTEEYLRRVRGGGPTEAEQAVLDAAKVWHERREAGGITAEDNALELACEALWGEADWRGCHARNCGITVGLVEWQSATGVVRRFCREHNAVLMDVTE